MYQGGNTAEQERQQRLRLRNERLDFENWAQPNGFDIERGEYGSGVRRLLPVECERLQGFPDNHTQIPWRGKSAAECPDGHRYKACGNSMAVPVMRWIGRRLLAFAVVN